MYPVSIQYVLDRLSFIKHSSDRCLECENRLFALIALKGADYTVSDTTGLDPFDAKVVEMYSREKQQLDEVAKIL